MFDFENMKIYISCLYNSISCFKTGFGILGQNEKQAVAELCQAQSSAKPKSQLTSEINLAQSTSNLRAELSSLLAIH